MTSKSASSPPNSAASSGPSQGVRSIVSLVLFLHLFCVFVALSTVYAPSELSLSFLRILRPYTQLLNFDLFVSYQLTIEAPVDVDHRIEVLPARKDENDALAWRVLPDVGLRGGERRLRYERLGELMDLFDGQGGENQVALMSASVGTYFLNHEHTRPKQIRLRRHTLVSIDAYTNQGTRELRDPNSAMYFSVVYAANAVIDDDLHRVDVVKIDAAGEVARPTGTP